MGLKGRLRKLERDAPLGGTLRIAGGTAISYRPVEMLDALCAAIVGRELRLLPYFRSVPTREGMPGLVKAIEGDASGA